MRIRNVPKWGPVDNRKAGGKIGKQMATAVGNGSVVRYPLYSLGSDPGLFFRTLVRLAAREVTAYAEGSGKTAKMIEVVKGRASSHPDSKGAGSAWQ